MAHPARGNNILPRDDFMTCGVNHCRSPSFTAAVTWLAEDSVASEHAPPAPKPPRPAHGAGSSPSKRQRARAAAGAAGGADDVAAVGRVRVACSVTGAAAVVVTRTVLAQFSSLFTCLLRVRP